MARAVGRGPCCRPSPLERTITMSALTRTVCALVCLLALAVPLGRAATARLGTSNEGPLPGGVAMRPGDTLRVQVNITFSAAPVILGLCGAISCSSVRVDGFKKGIMGFSVWRVLVNSPHPWAGDAILVKEHQGPLLFTRGDSLIFRVSLRAADGQLAQLAVSVEGAADEAVATALLAPQAGENNLKVLSEAGSAVLLGEAQPTDGHAMAVGEQVAAKFCATSEGLLWAGLCGAASCSMVVVYGLDDAGRLRYGTAVSARRNQLTGQSDWIETPEWTNSSFRAGDELELLVSRCSETEMQAWLRGGPEAPVRVPLVAERAVLKVLGQGGNVLLFPGGPGELPCPSPLTPSQAPDTPTTTTPRSAAPPAPPALALQALAALCALAMRAPA